MKRSRRSLLGAIVLVAVLGMFVALAIHRPSREEQIQAAAARMRQAASDLTGAEGRGDAKGAAQARARIREAVHALERLERERPGAPRP
ncbi:MAG: hypothetical protein ACYDCL_15825 [Myxococcales bacterium]